MTYEREKKTWKLTKGCIGMSFKAEDFFHWFYAWLSAISLWQTKRRVKPLLRLKWNWNKTEIKKLFRFRCRWPFSRSCNKTETSRWNCFGVVSDLFQAHWHNRRHVRNVNMQIRKCKIRKLSQRIAELALTWWRVFLWLLLLPPAACAPSAGLRLLACERQ